MMTIVRNMVNMLVVNVNVTFTRDVRPHRVRNFVNFSSMISAMVRVRWTPVWILCVTMS